MNKELSPNKEGRNEKQNLDGMGKITKIGDLIFSATNRENPLLDLKKKQAKASIEV